MKFKTDFQPEGKNEEMDIVDEMSTISPLEQLDKEFIAFQTRKPEDNKIDNDKEIKEKEEAKNEKELLLSVIKFAKNSGEKFGIDDIENLSLKKANLDKFLVAEFMLNMKRDSLNDDQIREYETILKDKEQMQKIYSDNYSDNKELKDKLIEDFNKFMSGSSEYYQNKGIVAYGSELYILKYKNQVISFNRFDLTRGGKLYFKFFNVDKNVQGSGLGQMMCKATLEKKAEKQAIVADCISSKPISSFYIENGFIARRTEILYGEPIMSIIRDDKVIAREFKTKNLSEEELVNGINLPDGTIVNRSLSQESCDFSYIIPENFQHTEDIVPYQLAKEKYVLTRYFFDKKSKEWITVFEPIIRELDDFL